MEHSQGLRPTRVNVNIKASYSFKGFEGEGIILDISSGGVGMEVKQIFVPGDLVKISFRVPHPVDENVEFWGIVRNVNSNIVGIQYEEISKETKEKIERYLGFILLRTGKPPKESY